MATETVKCEQIEDNDSACGLDAELKCESCGQETCNKHGSYRGDDDDPAGKIFICLDCQQEADREINEDHGPADAEVADRDR